MPNESHLPPDRPADLHPPESAVGPGYEVRDTDVRVVVVFLVSLVLFMIVVQVGLWGMLKGLNSDEKKGDTFVKPEVDVRAAIDSAAKPAEFGILEQYRSLKTYENEVLAGKTPAGKSSGKTYIPIDRAVDLLAERGIAPLPGPMKTEAEVNGHAGTPVSDSTPGAKSKAEGDKK